MFIKVFDVGFGFPFGRFPYAPTDKMLAVGGKHPDSTNDYISILQLKDFELVFVVGSYFFNWSTYQFTRLAESPCDSEPVT